MGFVKEFKEFAMRGNVLDMAVGIVIGGAFGKIVSSFVADLMTPLLGLLVGGSKFFRSEDCAETGCHTGLLQRR